MSSALCLLVSYILFVFFIGCEAARILAVFPTPSISHQVVFRPLTQELAKRGHEVTILTTDPAFPNGKTPPNLTEIDLHDMSYEMWKAFLPTATGNKDDLMLQLKTVMRLFNTIFEHQFLSEEVQKIVTNKNVKFDLLLVEACFKAGLAFSHVYKAPVILISSFGAMFDNYDVVGGPAHPILYPSIIHQKLYNLTLWERFMKLYDHYRFNKVMNDGLEVENAMLQRLFGEDAPTMTELNENIDMLFLNLHPMWEGNYPVPPNVIYMGGLHQKPEKELPKELKSYLDNSKAGVIYMSFGTNTQPSSLPPERIQMFVKVFSQLPYDILWKWDKESLPGQTKNIRIGKWFPQSDLLRHPKIKLFITQGGLQSTDEAITAGVPLIGIPMLGDQWFNVEKYLHHGIGLRLDIETLSENRLHEAIKTVTGYNSYKKNIARLRTLMREQLVPPLDRAVWWTEHVLRHGGASHLRSPAANISWGEYLQMDLLLILLAILGTAVTVASVIVYCVYVEFLRGNYFVKVKSN